MARALSLFTMAGLFLLISPGLRGHVFRTVGTFVDLLQNNSPYSYVIAILGIFAIFTISLNRGAQSR
jgi:hypothetical protein